MITSNTLQFWAYIVGAIATTLIFFAWKLKIREASLINEQNTSDRSELTELKKKHNAGNNLDKIKADLNNRYPKKITSNTVQFRAYIVSAIAGILGFCAWKLKIHEDSLINEQNTPDRSELTELKKKHNAGNNLDEIKADLNNRYPKGFTVITLDEQGKLRPHEMYPAYTGDLQVSPNWENSSISINNDIVSLKLEVNMFMDWNGKAGGRVYMGGAVFITDVKLPFKANALKKLGFLLPPDSGLDPVFEVLSTDKDNPIFVIGAMRKDYLKTVRADNLKNALSVQYPDGCIYFTINKGSSLIQSTPEKHFPIEAAWAKTEISVVDQMATFSFIDIKSVNIQSGAKLFSAKSMSITMPFHRNAFANVPIFIGEDKQIIIKIIDAHPKQPTLLIYSKKNTG